MENLQLQPVNNSVEYHTGLDTAEHEILSTSKPFIESNTVECSLQEIKDKHLVPVFIRDNESTISIAEFIEAAQETVSNVYSGERVLQPSIRLSHPIKGRIFEAKDKPAAELQEWEKTIHYERAAFIVELPNYKTTVDGNELSLTVGGVKSYNEDNLYSRKGLSDEHFHIFIGFKVKVCTNLCVWSDGYVNKIGVKNIGQLRAVMQTLFQNYNANFHLQNLLKLPEYELTESQFAHVLGRGRLYQHLPHELKKDIRPLMFGDQQLGAVARDFYKCESFCRNDNGNISLWKLYNLFTGCNKSTYIDSFLQKGVNAYEFAEQLRWSLENKTQSWFLN